MAAPRPVTTNAANVAFQAITQSDTDSDDHEGGMIPTRARGSPSITAGLNQIPITQHVSFLGCWLCDIDNEGKMKYESQQFFSMLHVCCRPTIA